jgi:hypothetical protein
MPDLAPTSYCLYLTSDLQQSTVCLTHLARLAENNAFSSGVGPFLKENVKRKSNNQGCLNFFLFPFNFSLSDAATKETTACWQARFLLAEESRTEVLPR